MKRPVGRPTVYRRDYETPITELKMPQHYYGFTNRILVQQSSPEDLNFFIPIYAILKIKSLQEIDIQKLSGSISCVLIVNVLIEGLPQPLIHLLQNSIEMQINRSEQIILKDSVEANINMAKNKKMLRFTIRKNVSATIMEDTLWSPFEIIRLIVSLTFNSISKRKGFEILKAYQEATQKTEEQQREELVRSVLKENVQNEMKKQFDNRRNKAQVSFNEYKRYTISFNCMRNGAQIPISYALGCVYSLYDLAENKLEVYHTKYDSYSEVIRNYTQAKKDVKKNQPEKRQQKSEPRIVQQSKKEELPSPTAHEVEISYEDSRDWLVELSEEVFEHMHKKAEKKDNKVKASYFQYTHFVIPLYKYPVNSLATIFIPIFLLALLSLGIFFQENDLSTRISSIATMVLGYIALIPSIKEQLPPSSRITIIEVVIYISTLCCLFSLFQSFMIDQVTTYVFDPYTNNLFRLCLGIHVGIFVFILALLVIHKFKWEPSYNKDSEARKTDPESNPHQWINFLCDEEFFKTNHKIYTNFTSLEEPKDQLRMIKKYEPEYVKQESPEKGQPCSPVNITVNQPKMGLIESMVIENPTQQTQASVLSKEGSTKDKKERLSLPGQEKVQQEKKKEKKEKPRKLLEYERHLKFVDDLIKKGGHVIWSKGDNKRMLSSTKSVNSENSPTKSREGYERVKED